MPADTPPGDDQGYTLTSPKEKDPKAAVVVERWSKGTRAIQEELSEYWFNFMFVEGHQWVWMNRQTNRIEEALRTDEERVRLTFNRMRSGSRTILGKLTQRDLVFEVMKSDADDAHMRGAKIGESLLENIRISHDWEQKREMAAWAAWKGGTAAICVEWDGTAGDVAAAPEDTGGTVLREGDTVETVLNLSEFICEPGTRDGERGRYWIKQLLLPPAEAKDQFDLSWMPAADGNVTMTPFQIKAMEKDQTLNTPLTRVLTMYERPNKQCPDGRICVVINDQVVFDKPWYFPWKDRLNLAIMKETPIETRWTGSTVLSDARGVQVAYNLSWSVIHEHMKRAGNARLAVPQSAVDMMEELTDLPGEFLVYPDGITEKPAWIAPAPQPQWWVDQPDKLAAEMDDIMGIHQVSRGDAPVNVDSGYGLSILAEHDATPIMRMSKETAIAWSKVATFDLKLYEKMAKGKKRKTIVQVPGQPPASIIWDGKDFKGQTTAVIPYDEIMPRSRAAQQEFANKMMEMKLINDPATYALVADLPNSRSFIDAISPDIAKARRENAGWSLNRFQLPAVFDDHMAHVMEHNRYRKSIDFELLGDTGEGGIPQAEWHKHIEDHIQAHITMAAEAAGQQTAGAAVGGPALAAIPQQGGAPPMDPSLMAPPPGGAAPPAPGPVGAPAGPASAEAGLSPTDTITSQVLAELNNPNPNPNA